MEDSLLSCETKLNRDKNKKKGISDKIKKCIPSIVIKEGFNSYAVTETLISTDGGNYFGILHEVHVRGQTSEGSKEINLFIKEQKSIIDHGGIVKNDEMFLKEATIYNKLAKVFNEMQDEVNVPLEDRFKMAKSYDESNEIAIILDNLSKKGYKTLNRLDVTSLKFMRLSVIQLAKFHGLSFALQKTRPNYLNSLPELHKFPVNFTETWEMFIENLFIQGLRCIDSEMRSKVSNLLPKIIEKLRYYLDGGLPSTTCLCHGDYRPSNIMVKTQGYEIIEVIPVDFQLVYRGSPLIDFLYLIFSSTDRQFRKDHLEDLKDLYHETLKDFLRYFGMDVETVYSKKQFEDDYKTHLDYGLVSSFWFFPFFFTQEDTVPDFEESGPLELPFNLQGVYKKRMEELIQDYVEWGYL